MNAFAKPLTTVILLISALAALAQQQSQPPQLQAAAEAPTGVWRYVDAQTLGVVRIDLTKVDPKAVAQWVVTTLKAGGLDAPDVGQGAAEELGLDVAARLRDAGAREVYVVLSLSAIAHQSGGWVVIPVPDGTDAEQIARPLFPDGTKAEPAPAGASGGPGGARVLRHGQAAALLVPGQPIVHAYRVPVAYFSSMTPATLPDLRKALADAGDRPVTVAVSPTDDTRKVIEQMLPVLPPPIGTPPDGTPATVVTRGLRAGYLALDLPPNPRLDAVIQAADPAAAQQLHQFATHLLTALAQDPGFRRDLPKGPEILASLAPKVDGSRVVLSLDAPATERVVSLLGASMGQARQQARRAESAKNLRQIGMAVQMYRVDHKAFPDDLNAVTRYLGGDEVQFKKILSNPRFPNQSPGYVYVKPTDDPDKVAGTRLLGYESFDQWPADGAWVLFADGHAELIADRARFDKLLADAKRPPRTD